MSKSLRKGLTSTSPQVAGAVPWPARPYQKDSVLFLLEHAGAGLFADPSTGKTSITLKALSVLKKEKMLGKVLIIAPLRVCYLVWPDEIKIWSDFNGLTYTILHGDDKDEHLSEDVDIYLINPDGLPWLMEGNRFKKLGISRLVVDESSYFKHTNTRRFKLLKPVLEKMRSRWILTGSPAPNGYLDLFGQVFIMDLGGSLGRYITHYKTQYFYPTGFGGYTWQLQPDADKRIQEKLKPFIRRLDADDLLQLPNIVNSSTFIDLPAKARRAYREMEVLMLTKIEEDTVSAASAAAASIKCRQIANGGLYMEDRDNVAIESDGWYNYHLEKANAVKEIIDELQGSPAMVAYDFTHDLDRLRQVLGKDVPHIGGGVSPKRSAELASAWNRGELPVLLVHPQAVGHGLNLQGGGNHMIFHSLIWNFELYDQLIRRLRRTGAKYNKVFVHHIVAKDTIDEIMLTTLGSKERVQGTFMKALRQYAIKLRSKTK